MQFVVALAIDQRAEMLVDFGHRGFDLGAALLLRYRPSATIRRMIVARLALMPTRGMRPRRMRSGMSDSTWLSPAPKHLMFRRRMTRPPPPMPRRAASR